MGLFEEFELLFLCIEMGIGYYLCRKIFEPRHSWSNMVLGMVTLLNVGFLFAMRMSGNMLSNRHWGMVVFLFVLAGMCLYQGKWTELLAMYFAWVTILQFTDVMTLIVISSVSGIENLGVHVMSDFGKARFWHGLFSAAVKVWLFYWASKKSKMLRQKVEEGPVLLIVLAAVCYYSVMQLQVVGWLKINYEFWWNYASNLILILAMVFLYIILEKHLKLQREKMEADQKEAVISMLYEEEKKKNQAVNETVHNVKHHIRVLKLLSENDDLNRVQEYLCEMEQDVSTMKEQIWTGDSMVDFLLNWKIGEAEYHGIKTKIDTEAFHCSMRETDCCTLIANLMDNAIEACNRITNGQREIEVVLRRKKNILVISVTNPIGETPKEVSGKFLSAKRKYETTGYGIESIKTIAKRYRGDVDIDYRSGFFRIEVRLQMREINGCI